MAESPCLVSQCWSVARSWGGRQEVSGLLGSTLPSVPGCTHGSALCRVPTDVDEERLNLRAEQEQSLALVSRVSQTASFTW